MERPYVGILINNSLYRKIPAGLTLYENLDLYIDGGEQHGLSVCFLRIKDLHPYRSDVKALVKTSTGFVQQRVPTPRVIHNRAIYSNLAYSRELEELAAAGTQIFNGWIRYGKLRIHELLMQQIELRPHLPATYKATLMNLQKTMQRFDSLIIKPEIGSFGVGIMKMDRTDRGWRLVSPRTASSANGKWCTRNITSRIPHFLIAAIQKKPYLIQQSLPLATFEGRPFDLRVSVQRGRDGIWQVTGIAAKVAAKNEFLTNVAQGASVHPLAEILAEYPVLDYGTVERDIKDFSLKTAEHLGRHLRHLADIGLDIGLTAEGYPLFIECNSKDQRYSFKEAGLTEEWQRTYWNPIAYARYLLEQSEV